MCSRVDGVEPVIYALGLAMSGKNPTMPPKNSSELASDSVLSKMLAASACMVCRGGGVRRGGWKAWQSARLHTAHRSRAIESAAASSWQHTPYKIDAVTGRGVSWQP